ncbi:MULTISPECIES: LysR family transcriptional regulator [Herbaspirillum]|jgi:DNA-binding transcriptional LysR family regulator|uniref:LysR substrate-binding domain-containing protein n=1 Tax=Herbaspirillum huttiense subsp. lycopersici TaxID=3074428 RepID=A0ABU2EEZ9_9BURK|nr:MULTISPECIES: LysR family transcriptional regulator [Herbaspirillum]MDR6738364.1 DNA-binding transcriptional LysR family regulator [Herbaspirillum sp. 1173]MDR9846719.1 LysR substrate-binding domain-containing protein [Herbaspirillum huttiense SE1]
MHANLSTRLLHAFLALADCRHFGHAAERCHVSQSAFSAMIQKLETATGARLFERDTRNVSLTPEGEVFVEVARQLVADMEAALADMNDYVARRKGRVAIAALPSLAAGWLPPVLAAYRQRHPGVAVELFDAISDQCLDLLRQGKADIALTAPGPNLLEFTTQPLCADPFYLVCRKDHALAGKRRIKVAQLAGCEMIHLARSTSVRQHLDAVLRPGAVIHTGLEVEHLATLAALIESGLGVSVVPELTLFQFRLPNLVAIPVDAPELVRPLLIVTPKERSLSIAAQGLLDLIQAKARAESATPARRGRKPQAS